MCYCKDTPIPCAFEISKFKVNKSYVHNWCPFVTYVTHIHPHIHFSKVGNISFRLTFNLAADIVSGAVLQPLLDVLANPDIINLLVEIGFSPEPSKSFVKKCGRDVVFLENFVNSHHTPSQSVNNMLKHKSINIST